MEIAFTPAGWRDWKKLSDELQTRLEGKLKEYTRDPLRYAVRLSDSKIGQYRFRIGDYRIIFDLAENTIIILAIGHRKDIYR